MTHRFTSFLFHVLFFVFFPSLLFAQREQVGLRVENFGSSGFSNPLVAVASPNPRFSAQQAHLNFNFRTILGEEGETVIYNGFQYRFLRANFDDVVFANLAYPSTREYHFLFYDFLVLHSLSDAYTLVAT
ncbi:MAG: hypothetical protein SNJ55_13070, partial [Chloroherpetonaceae bacterium]